MANQKPGLNMTTLGKLALGSLPLKAEIAFIPNRSFNSSQIQKLRFRNLTNMNFVL